MSYSFSCYGHPNITAKHKTTLEFTKDKHISLKGDCIIGVNADFDAKKIKDSLKSSKRIKIFIKVDEFGEEVNCEYNPGFNGNKELVIRKSGFISERTLGIGADKACTDLNAEMASKLKNSGQMITVVLSMRT
ncbi:MAG TPA: DUF371 domain-containing protein [Candidatus Nanoarchaeia archaeon]|nr:DUF371 domain-containing protein [Candidatus Nanoarchaeia archaeon]